MKINSIEAALRADVERKQSKAKPASQAFLRQFKSLVNHFNQVHDRYHITGVNLNVQSTIDSTHRTLTGFVFADDFAETARILELNPFAFDTIGFNPGRPIVETHITMRDDPNDALESETRLCRGDVVPATGQVDLYDASYERSDQFWEAIRLPGAKSIHYTDDPVEHAYGPGDFVGGNMIVPQHKTVKAQFESMHASLDIIDATPVWPLR